MKALAKKHGTHPRLAYAILPFPRAHLWPLMKPYTRAHAFACISGFLLYGPGSPRPTPAQVLTFLEVLPKYYEHLQGNPNSLIMKVFGLMRFTFSDGAKIYCIIFNNVLFNPYEQMNCIYDLKGASYYLRVRMDAFAHHFPTG
jgi:hypothetical protein